MEWYDARQQAGLMGDCQVEDEAVECVPDILIPDNLAEQSGAEETLLKIKSVAYRTDMGALDKINRIKGLLGRAGEEDVDSIGENGGVKRKNEEEVIDSAKTAKTRKDADGCGSEEETADCCCAVCGLRLEVFQQNPVREVQHYLSHGFTPLKEFNVLKSDDRFDQQHNYRPVPSTVFLFQFVLLLQSLRPSLPKTDWSSADKETHRDRPRCQSRRYV